MAQIWQTWYPDMGAKATATLMDDAEFLAELDRLEWGENGPDGAAGNELSSVGPREVPPPAFWSLDAEPQRPTPRAAVIGRELVVALIGFVLMMAVGAAGAALLFHDRVALLLR
ncbi:MAG TPA: hypothetical protein VFA59_06005 [Vicinamibacterales bacterium]|nr:hypothetical protein [Vicinamibacterales bacterium]